MISLLGIFTRYIENHFLVDTNSTRHAIKLMLITIAEAPCVVVSTAGSGEVGGWVAVLVWAVVTGVVTVDATVDVRLMVGVVCGLV